MRTIPSFCIPLFLLSACQAGGDLAPAGERGLDRVDREAVSGGGGGGPITTCGNDGLCNLAYCSISEDPDCVEENCDADNHCNVTCESDPDCPVAEQCDRSGATLFRPVTTWCGRSTVVRVGASDPMVLARAHIESKWPNFRDAKDLDYDEDNDGINESGESCWREGHAEANLEGFGVTLTRGTCGLIWSDYHANDDPMEPSLLAFEKTTGSKDTWQIIGAEYHYHYDSCEVPCLTSVPESRFLIHEAGWHRVPGDGGFDCIQQKWVDTSGGVPVVDVFDQCADIHKDDFHRSNITFGANKHERVWTMHMFFEPGTNGIALAEVDPWCRDIDDADDEPVVTVDCPETEAFYPLTDNCDCN